MSPAALTQAAVCERYDALAVECEAARQAWSERRAQIVENEVQGKETEDELRSLQAKCAKSAMSIIYAAASCVNLREELLAVQASLPMCKTAIITSVTVAVRFLTLDYAVVSSRKTAAIS
jgi:hypothetical protein